MILNVSSVVEVVAFFLFKISGVFYAVAREISGDVAPTSFSVSAVLGLVTELSAMVTFSVEACWDNGRRHPGPLSKRPRQLPYALHFN